MTGRRKGMSNFQFTTSKRRSTKRDAASEDRDETFNSRPPRGGRLANSASSLANSVFQFTTSKRRSTYPVGNFFGKIRPFNSRPPRGGRPRLTHDRHCTSHLSIHDLQEEVDSSRHSFARSPKVFQFTTSKRRSTKSATEPVR